MNSLYKIKTTVERITGFEFAKNTSRAAGVEDAKRIYCHLARSLTKSTCKEVGEYIGKDHTLVVYHVKKANALLEFDKKFETLYKMCLNSLSRNKQLLDKYAYYLNSKRRRFLAKNYRKKYHSK